MITYKTFLCIVVIFGIEISSCNCIPPNIRNNICESEVCHETAKKLKQSIDFSINPCTDFYQFSCRKFFKDFSIPKDKQSFSPFNIMADKLSSQLDSSFKEEINQNDPKSVRLIKTLYQNCMDTTFIEAQGLKPLREVLDILGGWPILGSNSNNDKNFDWIKFEYKSRNLGISTDAFISLYVDTDINNTKKRIISESIDAGTLDLQHEDLVEGLENKNVKAYLKFMVDVAVMLNKDLDRNLIEQELKEAINFSIELDKLYLLLEERRNPDAINHPMKISELQNAFPGVAWLEFINQLLEPNQKVDDNEIINVADPNYLRELNALVQSKPKSVQANYALWRVIFNAATYFSDDISSMKFEYETTTEGRSEREPRWKECTDFVQSKLGLAASALYVRDYIDDETRKGVADMVANIRDQFRKTISESTWMHKETMAKAFVKLDAMRSIIGYPDALKDSSRIEKFYETLEISRGELWKSTRNISLHQNSYSTNQLREPVDKNDLLQYGSKAVEINGFYSLSDNNLFLTAALLHDVLYTKGRPLYMNYGAVGFVIGHEITHGFDDQGSRFDKDGNEANWWDSVTKARFEEKVKCIAEQYGRFDVRVSDTVSKKINTKRTQGENIADSDGIRQAYLAYKAAVARGGEEPALPGFEDFTGSQMFWISMSSMVCVARTEEALLQLLNADYHVPEEFRVIGALQNQQDFARDFQCRDGDYMNPEKKCRVW